MGGAAYGFKMAGHQVIGSVEFDPSNPNFSKACDRQHSLNFQDSKFYLDTIQNVAPHLRECDILQASPPCTTASIANPNQGETALDIELAKSVIQAIATTNCSHFMLENVSGYIKYESFRLILKHLYQFFPLVEFSVIDMADYGIPQSRKRLILLASKSGWSLPNSTKKMGWSEAIAGLSLEPATLLPKQKGMIGLVNRSGNAIARLPHQPCWTLTRSHFVDGKGQHRKQIINVVDDKGVWNLPMRAIARLGGFPDSFRLDEKYGGEGIGYSVPPRFVKLLASELNI
jgi:DNA (cytosine-5)-methyltransferase 1